MYHGCLCHVLNSGRHMRTPMHHNRANAFGFNRADMFLPVVTVLTNNTRHFGFTPDWDKCRPPCRMTLSCIHVLVHGCLAGPTQTRTSCACVKKFGLHRNMRACMVSHALRATTPLPSPEKSTRTHLLVVGQSRKTAQ